MPAADPGYNQPTRRKRKKPQRTGAVGRGADTTKPVAGPPAPPPPPPVRPKKPSPAFRPIKSQAAPFKPQQERAKRDSRRAESKLPYSPAPYQPRGRDVPQARSPEPTPFRISPGQTSRSPAFRPIGAQTGPTAGSGGSASPFRVQQSRARQATRQARNKLPDHPDIPEVEGMYLKSDLDKVDDVYKRARLAAANAKTPEEVRHIQAEYEKRVRSMLDQPPEVLIGRVREAYKQAARKLGGTSINDLYGYGSLRQRRQIRKVGRTVADFENAQATNIAHSQGREPYSEVAQPIKPVDTSGMNPVQASLLPLDKITRPVGRFLDEHTRIPNETDASLFDLGNIPLQLGRATVESPEAVARSSLRTAVESITGIPQGVKELVTNPTGAVGAMAEDYERRYGSIFDNPAEFRKRVKEESGLTPFVLDAASLGVPVGRGATMLARSGASGRAVAALARVADEHGVLRPLSDFANTSHRAARAPRDAKRLANLRSQLDRASLEGDTARQSELRKQIKDAEANVSATERPALRFSGGEGGVRKQASSPNLFIGLGQRALDRTRRGAYEKRVGDSGMSIGPGGRLVIPDDADVTSMTAFRPGDREVVPKTTGVIGRSGRELPGLRKYTGRTARDLGGEQSVNRIKLLTHRGRVLNKVDKALKRLDSSEQDGMKYMLQLGATPDEAGVRILRDRREQIIAGRDAAGVEEIQPILRSTNDELALIDRILEDPDAFLTPRARQVADELRELQIAEARRDPELTEGQELIRRMSPQGKALGVERAPDVEFFRDVLRGVEEGTRDEHGVLHAPGLAEYADELAALHPSERGARAKELLKVIRKQRKGAERNVETDRARLRFEKGRIRQAEGRGVPYEDDAVRAARGTLAEVKRARRRIGRAVTRAERTAGRVAGRVGEREARGGPLATSAVSKARRAVSAAQKKVNRLERRLPPSERRAGRASAGGPAKPLLGVADLKTAALRHEIDQARDELRVAQEKLHRAEADAPRITPSQYQAREQATRVPEDLRRQLEDADAAVAAAQEGLRDALKDAPRVSPAQLARRTKRQRELAASRETRRHVRKFEKAMKQVVKASKSKSTMRLEDAESFAARVKDAAEEFGLTAPAYWWSSLQPRDMASFAATGKGLRAAHANKAYKGTLFDIGAEEAGTNVFTRGIERNIKRRFQQALVVRNMETHAYEWSRGPGGAGMTIADLDKAMIERAIDPSTVEFVDPRVLKRRYTEQQGVERGSTVRERDLDDMTDDDWITTTQQDLAESRRRWSEISNDERLVQGQHRFLAVPREVGETLQGLAAGMDNKFWRSMEVVLKQKPARILLGAANIPWLSFQIASNAMLTGLGGGVNPFNVHGARKWFKSLTPDEREAIEAELGITHGHHFGMDQPHLGATNNRMVNFWRGYKKSRVGRLGTTVNPLNLMFRADEAQNNFFRKVLFYDRARKSAYGRMGNSWRGISDSMDRVTERVLAQPPNRQANLIAQHGAEFEKIAKHVNDFLGDYLRFTPSERFLLQRNVMFYGYLRFSLRFTFYTMPVAHPVMANIMSNVGRMGAQEIKELMGVGRGYSLPASILSQTYFGDRRDAKKGDLRSLPLGRFNPFLNALTQLDGGQQAFGLVSPIYQSIADQMFEESSFTGRDWRIGGRPTPSEADRPRNYFGNMMGLLDPTAYSVPGVSTGKPRNRIFQNSLLSLAFPYRLAEQTGIPGLVDPLAPNQSDDALLWQPQPMQYADPGAQKGVDKSRRQEEERGTLGKLGAGLLPVVPKRTSTPAVIERELEREDAIRKRNSRKPGARRKRRRRARSGSRYKG